MRRLVVLRPEPGASASLQRARAIGLEAVAMPLFAIEAVAWGMPAAGQFDALLLTSANAVRHGGNGLEELRALPVYAVGDATAAAAREAGFDIAREGNGGVEQLLGSIPVGLRLLHLCGEHRIAAPATHAVPVYRSVELPPPENLSSIEGAVVAVHSPRAGGRLAELAVQLGVDRTTVRIAAISEAAAGAAGDGWAMREAAAAADDEALLALAARLCDKPVTR
ncbi:MAG: uroporphyrinogen-III synthase [Sphingomicrobium sp.]